MGYIFDAMNKAGGDELPDQPTQDAFHKPEPTEPAELDAAPPNLAFDSEATGGQPSIAADADETTPDADADVDPLAETNDAQDDETGREDIAPTLDFDSLSSPIDVQSQWINRVDDRLIALTQPSSIMAEEYRAIRTSMLARWDQRRRLIHTITSATPQEGKTITSLNLGLSFAELRNRKTIVVECDLRLPTFAKLLDLEPREGLVAHLRGKADLNDIIQTVGDGGLHIMPAGGRANNESVQLLSGQRMTRLLETLRGKFDHVIIDTPPVVELADAGILGAMSDDVLLIARMNRTPRPLIEQAIRTLKSYNAPVAGMIATDQKRLQRKYYYYRYGYRRQSRYYAKEAA